MICANTRHPVSEKTGQDQEWDENSARVVKNPTCYWRPQGHTVQYKWI